MSNVTEIFRLFFFDGWRRQTLIMLAMLLGVAAENVSIASLWPIIGILTGDAAVLNSPAPSVTCHDTRRTPASRA